MYNGYFIWLSLLVSMSVISGGCSQISLTGRTRHNLIPDTTANQQSPAAPNLSGKNIDLSGQWRIGFRYRGAVITGMMLLKQDGQNFSGYGKDNENGAAFKISHGEIKGNEIIFLKSYDNDPRAPVQCHGQFSLLAGENGEIPYMGGDFSREINGNITTGDWEAAFNQPENNQAVKMTPPENENPVQQNQQEVVSGRAPDLSGKWEVAFEYNFKIIHSTMFIEQEGNKLTGHGVDKENGALFIIKKGWYSFPTASFTREYPDTKKHNQLYHGHEMTFKADVTVVNDKDYQGPYLSGKTQGGGSWEAERIN